MHALSFNSCFGRVLGVPLLSAFLGIAISNGAVAQAGKEEARNMRLVGHVDLHGRNAYHPTIHQQGNRWIAYVGHHGGLAANPGNRQSENNGTSIVDVTDPKNPRQLFHIPGEKGEGEVGGAQMVRMCAGKMLSKGDPNKFYLLRSLGNTAHELWDVIKPEQPTLLKTVVSGIKDTHKNFWECDTGIAYLVSGVDGWKTRRMLQIFDLSDPVNPRHIRDFGLAGQEPSAPESKEMRRFDLHGAIRAGNRIYMGYGTFLDGVIQILDCDKLLRGNSAVANSLAPTPDNLTYPEVTRLFTSPRMGAHTTFPVLGVDVPEFARNSDGKTRDILVVVNESLRNECQAENRQLAYFVDITTETKPWLISNFQVADAGGNFCERGGRFGTHSSNENMTPIYYKRLIFLAYFNAGIRAVDIRDPWSPKEVGYYIPPITAKTAQRCIKVNGVDRCKVAIQTNNLEVDDRGFIYAADRANTGMHILELTGSARAIAKLP